MRLRVDPDPQAVVEDKLGNRRCEHEIPPKSEDMPSGDRFFSRGAHPEPNVAIGISS
jgi:hypothetical protein